jgi:hypothetical protein
MADISLYSVRSLSVSCVKRNMINAEFLDFVHRPVFYKTLENTKFRKLDLFWKRCVLYSKDQNTSNSEQETLFVYLRYKENVRQS